MTNNPDRSELEALTDEAERLIATAAFGDPHPALADFPSRILRDDALGYCRYWHVVSTQAIYVDIAETTSGHYRAEVGTSAYEPVGLDDGIGRGAGALSEIARQAAEAADLLTRLMRELS